MSAEEQLQELRFATENLYREDVFSDQQIGAIRRMTPVTANGEDDPSRKVRFAGQTQLMTPAGALPLSFEIEADSLEEATEKFAPAAQEALEKTMEELREMRRQAASSIVVPGAGVDPGGMPGGGIPGGGGKIQMP